MATRVFYVHLVTGEPEHIDGLCTTCWCSTLWSIPMHMLTDTGVRSMEWSGCVECKKRSHA